MKRIWAVPAVLAVLGLLVVLLPGCGAEEKAAQDDAETVVPVTVAEAYRGGLELVSDFSGTVEPEMVVNVVHRSGGKVVEVKVKNGDTVKVGDVLLRLESTEIEAQVAQAEAGYQIALANMEKVKAGTRIEQLEQSRAALQAARAQYDEAKRAHDNLQILYREGAVSKQQLDQVETQYKVAGAQLKQAEEALKMAESGATAQDIKIVEAQVSQAAAALRLIRTQLDNTIITAPIEGTVSGVVINPGEMAGPGVPVAAINKLEIMEVRVQLTEKDVGRIVEGQEVDVLVSAVSPQPLRGIIHNISPVADPRTRTYQMKVALSNEGGLLRGGMTAVVQIAVAVEKDAVIVPVEAVLTQQGEQVVYVVEDGVAQRRVVTIGLENGNAASVLEGVSPGEQVVVSGQHYLQDADRVTVVGGGAD